MELKVSHCFIAVHDHDEALAFYRDVLGLEVRNDVVFEGLPMDLAAGRHTLTGQHLADYIGTGASTAQRRS